MGKNEEFDNVVVNESLTDSDGNPITSGGSNSGSGTKINVADHGAVGDGNTDDTNAIVNAISVAEENGQTVYLPSGTFLVDADIITLNNSSLTGNGMDTSTIKINSGGNRGVVLGNNGSSLSNFTLDGGLNVNIGIFSNGINNSIRNVYTKKATNAAGGSAGVGISIHDPNGTIIDGCRVSDIEGPVGGISRGIATGGSAGQSALITNCEIWNIDPDEDGDGIAIGADEARTRVSGCYIHDYAKSGIKIDNAGINARSVVSNNIIGGGSPTFGVRIQQDTAIVSNNILISNDFGQNAIVLQGGSNNSPSNVSIIGNTIETTNPSNIGQAIKDPQAGKNIAIVGNAIDLHGANADGINLIGTIGVVVGNTITNVDGKDISGNLSGIKFGFKNNSWTFDSSVTPDGGVNDLSRSYNAVKLVYNDVTVNTSGTGGQWIRLNGNHANDTYKSQFNSNNSLTLNRFQIITNPNNGNESLFGEIYCYISNNGAALANGGFVSASGSGVIDHGSCPNVTSPISSVVFGDTSGTITGGNIDIYGKNI